RFDEPETALPDAGRDSSRLFRDSLSRALHLGRDSGDADDSRSDLARWAGHKRVTHAPHETGVVLSGGGARAAYQIGVLRAVAKLLGRNSTTPFRVICGTSAGAVNAALLAAHADNFRCGVARLLRLWRNIEVRHVYKADFRALSRHGMRWLASV